MGARRRSRSGNTPNADRQAIRALKPDEKPYKAADSLGLYLLIQPNRSRLWRFKSRFAGKEKLAALGAYPETGPAEARVRRDELRRLHPGGVDPIAHRRAADEARVAAAENSFKVLADEWFQKKSPGWVPKHSVKIRERLKHDVYPWLGTRPIAEITAPEAFAVLDVAPVSVPSAVGAPPVLTLPPFPYGLRLEHRQF